MTQNNFALGRAPADSTIIIGSLSSPLEALDVLCDTEIFERAQIFVSSAPRTADSVPPLALPTRPPPPATARPGTVEPVAGFVGLGALACAVVLFVVAVAGPRLLVRRSAGWISPVVISTADPQVIEVRDSLANAHAEHGRLVREEEEALARKDAIDGELEGGKETALLKELAARRAEAVRLHRDILDRDLAGSDRLSSDEMNAKLRATRRRIRAIESELRGDAETSEQLARERDVLTTRLRDIRARLVANDALVKQLEESPYQLEGDAVLGFAPNENATAVAPGTPLEACRWGTLACTRVGAIDEVFPGETSHTSPLDERTTLRGRLVRITLTRRDASRRPVLFTVRGR